MKSLIPLFVGLTLLGAANCGEAAGRSYVRGHFRSNGTYVAPHYRTTRDSSFYNNWSSIGNVNPYTGKLGTKTQPTYRLAPASPALSGIVFAHIPTSVPILESANPGWDEKLHGEMSVKLAPGREYDAKNSSRIEGNVTTDQPKTPLVPYNVRVGILVMAERQWPESYTLQKQFVAEQIAGYKNLVGYIERYREIGVPADITNWALRASQEQWFEDFNRQAVEYERAIEGYLRLSALMSSDEFKGIPQIHSDWMLEVAYVRWSEDFNEQADFLERQLDGYMMLAKLMEDAKDLPEAVTDGVMDRARARWPSDLLLQSEYVASELGSYEELIRISR